MRESSSELDREELKLLDLCQADSPLFRFVASTERQNPWANSTFDDFLRDILQAQDGIGES